MMNLIARKQALNYPLQEEGSGTAGFTLIEMLVVLAIIGLIMGLVGPRVLNYLSSSKERAAEIQVKSLATSIDLFYLDIGRYPTEEEGLKALVVKPAGLRFWGGPYLKTDDLPLDPAGKPFVYHIPGRNSPYEISRSGADARSGPGETVDIERVPDLAKGSLSHAQ